MAEADPFLRPPDLSGTGAGTDPGTDDWPAKATATITQYVGTVRDKTTGPVLDISRNAVYYLVMGLVGLVLAILALVLLVRVLVSATAELAFVNDGETWLAYFIIGALFILIGSWLWGKKEP